MTAATTLRGSGAEADAEGAARGLLERRFALSSAVPSRFFREHAEEVSEVCEAMARRFERGGRLLVFGAGAQASDAAHVAVEFVHPVLVGKRALPALAVAVEPAAWLPRLTALARPDDIAMAIDVGGSETALAAQAALAASRARGLLTVALVGTDDRERLARSADHLFAVPSDDPLVIQETHETLYHVLWELVHLFFNHSVPR